jgi:hypothetical protein
MNEWNDSSVNRIWVGFSWLRIVSQALYSMVFSSFSESDDSLLM